MELKKLEWAELSRNEKRLFHAAFEARKKADVPLTKVAVGGAVLTDIGNMYSAPNDESRGMSRNIHAADAAIAKKRDARLDEEIIAVIEVAILDSKDPNNNGFPCADCRQAIWDETGNPNLVVYGAGVSGAIFSAKLKWLYPYPHPTRKKWLTRRQR